MTSNHCWHKTRWRIYSIPMKRANQRMYCIKKKYYTRGLQRSARGHARTLVMMPDFPAMNIIFLGESLQDQNRQARVDCAFSATTTTIAITNRQLRTGVPAEVITGDAGPEGAAPTRGHMTGSSAALGAGELERLPKSTAIVWWWWWLWRGDAKARTREGGRRESGADRTAWARFEQLE